MRFKEYIRLCESGYFGSMFDNLGLPTVERRGVIEYIDNKKNPIYIVMRDPAKDDRTQLYIPFDRFREIKPEVGKTITVVFQRRADDKSGIPSQVQSIRVE